MSCFLSLDNEPVTLVMPVCKNKYHHTLNNLLLLLFSQSTIFKDRSKHHQNKLFNLVVHLVLAKLSEIFKLCWIKKGLKIILVILIHIPEAGARVKEIKLLRLTSGLLFISWPWSATDFSCRHNWSERFLGKVIAIQFWHKSFIRAVGRYICHVVFTFDDNFRK